MHDKFWQHTQKNHWGIQRDTALYLCCVSSLKSSRDSSTLVSNQSLTHCSHGAGGLSTRGSSIDQVTLLTQDIRIAFRLRRRHELCLSISQQPTTLYGIVASPASCYNCYLIDTWSTWSWRWLAIAASPLRNGKRIRLRRLKNGVPQRFFLAPLLFNMHLYLWPAKCRLQKVSMHRYWRCSNHACWWRLADSGRGAEQGHGSCRWIPPGLENKAQHYSTNTVSAAFHQRGS